MEHMWVQNRTTSDMEPVKTAVAIRTTSAHRRHLRTRVEHLMVKIRVGHGAVIARVDDISMGGFFAATTQVIPFGAFIELSLLCAEGDEISIGGVVVDDIERRRGLAVRFEAMSAEAGQQLRRVVEQQHDRECHSDPDKGVARARLIRAPGGESDRDDALAALRMQVAVLTTDNKRLRAEAAGRGEAEQLVGRLRIEVERLKRQVVVGSGIAPDALDALKREADTAWTAMARLADAVASLK